MSEELQIAFEQMANRGRRVGAQTLVARSLDASRSGDAPRVSPRRFAAFAAVTAVVAVVVAGVVVVRSRVPDVERVNVGGALEGGDGLSDTMTVLAVGTDGGPDREGARADAVMLLRLDRSSGAVSILSLPRDLYVAIAGTGATDRLSVAFVSGRSALIETVRAVTGVAFDHYLEFDFSGFAQVVDAAGGVDLQIHERIRDELSGLDLPAGCNHLDGETALAYVRSRHVLEQDPASGRFVAEPTGDIGRIGRQQLLFLVALDQLTRTRNPARIDRIAQAIEDNVRVDDAFSVRDAIAFGKNWMNTDGPLQMLVYPFSPMSLPNGAAVLEPDTSQAPDIINHFNNPPTDQPPRGVPGASCQ